MTAEFQSDPESNSTSAAVPASATNRRRAILINVVRYLLLAFVIVAALWALFANWTQVSHQLAELQWQRVAVSLIAVFLGIGAATMSWQVLVDDLGKPIGVGRGAQVFLVGLLGKYLPGSVWAYVLQIELGRKAGLARARVFAATLFSLAVAVVAALIAGAVAVPELISNSPELSWLPWLYLLLPIALVFLYPPVLTALVRFAFRVLRRPRPDHPVRLSVVVQSLGWAVLSYVSYGTHLWLLADTGEGLTLGPLALCIGTMGVGMLVSLVAFMVPSGVGVRELVIVTALTPVVGVGAAIAYAAVSRLMFIVADLVSAGAAAALAVVARRRQGVYHGDPGIQ